MCHLLFTLLCFLSQGPKTPHSTIQLQLNTSHNLIFTHPTHCSPSVSPSLPLLVLFSDFSSSFTLACLFCISLLPYPPNPWLLSSSCTTFYLTSHLSSAASYLDVHLILQCSIPEAKLTERSAQKHLYTPDDHVTLHLACMVIENLHFVTACFNIYSSYSPFQQTGTCPCCISPPPRVSSLSVLSFHPLSHTFFFFPLVLLTTGVVHLVTLL